MKKTNLIKTVIVGAIMAAALGTLTGCSVEKNFTKTETHTYTDADGNTTTTIKTNNNGVVTEETRTYTAEEMMASNEEDMEIEELSDAVIYEKVPVAITNEMGWDVAEFYVKMSNQDEWSNNFLSEDQYIDDGTTANGMTVNYNEEQRFMDIRVADADGEIEEFIGIELPAEGAKQIEVVFKYDEENDVFTAHAEKVN